MNLTTSPWTDADAEALRQTRARRHHKWHQCVAALVQLGAPTLSQGTLSKWENGKSSPKLPESVRAVRAYCSDESAESEPDEDVDFDGVEAAFNDTVEALLGEKPLSGRRAQIVDAIAVRIRTGPPFSDADRMVIELLLS